MNKLEIIGEHSLGGLRNLTELYITDSNVYHIDSNALNWMEVNTYIWPPVRKVCIKNFPLLFEIFT